MNGKKKIVIIYIVLLILICVVTRFHIYTINSQRVLLFYKADTHGIGSAKLDILNDFGANGMFTESVSSITYIGSNRNGDYFLCKYVESDGTVTDYFAFNDNDWNSSMRARVLWDGILPSYMMPSS